MDELILKELFRLKLKILDYAIDRLPPDVKKHAKDVQLKMFRVVSEVTSDYVSSGTSKNCEKELKSISID
ncbi:MAG: hypothetical protein N3B21_12710 [Clostridia bacterium]|nr:hypothetical protein [Clostridia bacterium]